MPELSVPALRRTAVGRLAVQIRWRNGAVAGLLATLAMSAAIALTDLETLRVAVAGLSGSEGHLFVGWLAHLIHGVLFGVLFAAVLTDAALEYLTDSPTKCAGTGAVYGLVLAVVGAGSSCRSGSRSSGSARRPASHTSRSRF